MKRKKFNITGLCVPAKHFMVNVSAKLDAIMELVDDGSYFVINRPRQYGKTTILSLLEDRLHEHLNYTSILISFEGIGEESYEDEEAFITALMRRFRKIFLRQQHDAVLSYIEAGTKLRTLSELDEWIFTFVTTLSHPLVLMIDEVDKSSNHQLFLNFLGLLRTKYLEAARGKDVTFHSVILAGVHDIKSLKLKLRPDDERKYNSPWNIAVDFRVDLGFSPSEIQTMLADYCEVTGAAMDLAQIADCLWEYTSGYPFLVSALCKILDEELKRHTTWQVEDVEEAVSLLLTKSNTNFDHLIKNLENNPDFARLVEQILLFEQSISFNQDNPLIHLGVQYGILAGRNNLVVIHNRIYRERIYNYLASLLETGELMSRSLEQYTFPSQFVTSDGSLDLERVLLKFQEFMKQEYSQRDTAFLERNGRLVFFAFLRPILNGRGFAFKEPQISEEKRLDVVITFGAQKYVIELKIWRGDEKHQQGLRQLADYLECSGHDHGALAIFDFTQKGQKSWKQELIQVDDKQIFAVWV